MKKFLNIYLIQKQQHKKFYTTEEIANYVGMDLVSWYLCVNFTQWLPKRKVKKLCEFLEIKESEIYI
jgi:hypothetical protein